MDEFAIEGGRKLSGEVCPSGNKNAALPLLAACLLTDQPVVLHNVPKIRDVQTMIQLLADVGADVSETDDHTLVITARDVRKAELSPVLCRDIRGVHIAGRPDAGTLRTGRATAARRGYHRQTPSGHPFHGPASARCRDGSHVVELLAERTEITGAGHIPR